MLTSLYQYKRKFIKKIKNRIKRFFVNVLINHPKHSKFIFYLSYCFPINRFLRLHKIDYVSNLANYKRFDFSQHSKNHSFHDINTQKQTINSKKLNGIGYATLMDAEIISGSEFIFKKGMAYKQFYILSVSLEHIKFSNFKGSIANNSSYILCHKNKYDKAKLNKIIYLSGSYDNNWYHWLIEILPKLYLIKKYINDYKTYDLVISESVFASKTHMESLKLIAKNDKIVLIKPGVFYKAKEILYVETPANSDFETKKPLKYVLKNGNFYAEVLKSYKLFMEKQILRSEKKFGKYIYLYRNQNTRKFNQNEIINLIRLYGFEVVDTAKLSFSDQVNLFKHAEIILGASGAAWTNIIFSSSKTKALIFYPSKMGDSSTFPNLASVPKAKLYQIDFQIQENDWQSFIRSNKEATVNIIELEEKIRKMINN